MSANYLESFRQGQQVDAEKSVNLNIFVFLKNVKNLFFLYKFKKASAVDETRQISKLLEGQHMWKVSHEIEQRLPRKNCLKLVTHKNEHTV
jgi:hypothetical protein